ncbi:hypothetical protein Q8A73_020940 [Channa argus]|nr:hypothetical protein Q8A73_020940 [Channa argus]
MDTQQHKHCSNQRSNLSSLTPSEFTHAEPVDALLTQHQRGFLLSTRRPTSAASRSTPLLDTRDTETENPASGEESALQPGTDVLRLSTSSQPFLQNSSWLHFCLPPPTSHLCVRFFPEPPVTRSVQRSDGQAQDNSLDSSLQERPPLPSSHQRLHGMTNESERTTEAEQDKTNTPPLRKCTKDFLSGTFAFRKARLGCRRGYRRPHSSSVHDRVEQAGFTLVSSEKTPLIQEANDKRMKSRRRIPCDRTLHRCRARFSKNVSSDFVRYGKALQTGSRCLRRKGPKAARSTHPGPPSVYKHTQSLCSTLERQETKAEARLLLLLLHTCRRVGWRQEVGGRL